MANTSRREPPFIMVIPLEDGRPDATITVSDDGSVRRVEYTHRELRDGKPVFVQRTLAEW